MRAVPALAIAVELLAGVLACVPGGERWALGLAILMHLVFGVSGNYPFSVVALALWVTVFSPDGAIEPGGPGWILWAGALLVGLLSMATGRTAKGPRSAGWLIKDFYQGASTAPCVRRRSWPRRPAPTGPRPGHPSRTASSRWPSP